MSEPNTQDVELGRYLEGIPSLVLRLSRTACASSPPTGKCKILNIYFDPSAQEQVVEYNEMPIP